MADDGYIPQALGALNDAQRLFEHAKSVMSLAVLDTESAGAVLELVGIGVNGWSVEIVDEMRALTARLQKVSDETGLMIEWLNSSPEGV